LSSRNNAPKTRGKPFEKGNPGRRKGARHKVTVAAQALLDGEAEALTRTCIDKAKEGDMTALRLCLERIVPPRKDRPIDISLPKVETAADVAAAHGAIIEAMAMGEITPDEANTVAGVLEARRKAIETVEHEARVSELEAKGGAK